MEVTAEERHLEYLRPAKLTPSYHGRECWVVVIGLDMNVSVIIVIIIWNVFRTGK